MIVSKRASDLFLNIILTIIVLLAWIYTILGGLHLSKRELKSN